MGVVGVAYTAVAVACLREARWVLSIIGTIHRYRLNAPFATRVHASAP
jgi:hypothetical protein